MFLFEKGMKKEKEEIKSWEVEQEEVHTECFRAQATIWVAWEVEVKVDALMDAMAGKEWLAYLIGERIEDPNEPMFVVTDLLIPEQEVTAASVEVIDHPPLANVVGVVHSHHSMGSFFSQTDHDFVNSNHPLSIVVSGDGWKAVAKIRVPCGALIRTEPEIVFEGPPAPDVSEWLAAARERIRERKIVPVKAYQAYSYYGGYGRDWEGEK